MYSLIDYCNMLMDEVRVNTYVEALRHAIKPGDVVLDLGAGAGFFSVLACQFGASKVYAIECNETIEMGPQLAAGNGCSDRITFIKEMSTRVNLPEQVDVIVADLRGSLPLYFGSAASLIDARKRFLKPKGILLPLRDTVFATIVDAPDWYEKTIDFLIQPRQGVDQSVYRKILCNQFYKSRVAREELLTEPQIWATLEYATMEEHDFAAMLEWKALRTGTAHGLSLWFEAEISTDEKFSTAPFAPERTYGNPLLIFPKPVAVNACDKIFVQLSATLIDEEYVWRWDTKITGDGGEVKADYTQSTFFGNIISPASLRKQASAFVPTLNEEGRINAFVMAQINGKTSLQTIAENLCDHFPHVFPTWQKAMKPIGDIAKKFSQ